MSEQVVLFRGREYIVWFTNSMSPVGEGVRGKFMAYSGLIVKVYDSEKFLLYSSRC